MPDPTLDIAPDATTTTNSDGTGYVVLKQGESTGADWKLVGHVSARSAEAAIRAHAQKAGGDSAGVFVAVPARSWQPARVTSKVTTALVIEGVDA